MLLGAPVFAVFYLLFAEFISGRLRKKNLPTDTDDYTGTVSEFSREFIHKPDAPGTDK